jgi:hypothetical protein
LSEKESERTDDVILPGLEFGSGVDDSILKSGDIDHIGRQVGESRSTD